MTSFIEKIPGQEQVRTNLFSFINDDKIPHALLFTGQPGVGKDNAAILFASEIIFRNSENKNQAIEKLKKLNEPVIKFICKLPRGKAEDESSGPFEKLNEEELSFVKEEFEKKSANPFYQLSIPKANNIKISSVRDIKRFLSMNYDDLTHRFILISEAHSLNEEAQNALLKNLEEPPENVIFILTTPHPEKLRETIRSRCWQVKFNSLEEKIVEKILCEKFGVEAKLASSVSEFSEGSVSLAIKLIENYFENLKERTIRILRYSFGKRFHSAFEEIKEILSDSNKEELELQLKMILIWLNDLNKHKLDRDDLRFSSHRETFEKFNSKFLGADVTPLINKIDELSGMIYRNINLNLIASNLLSELSLLPEE